MPVTDQIGDFLTRIRNAGAASHSHVEAPKSQVKVHIAEILVDQGFIDGFEVLPDGVQGKIRIKLRYYQKKPVIKEMKRISKPGRRVYAPVELLPKVHHGLGIAIISTSKGIMTDKQARQFNVGGEIICTIW
ncbi:MAG: 30S ribosomal protein S8 [Ignavibacteria bacterium GWF2_33_9]|nr:MAG: 30S ribosomal protein S8 [Ignavibacteria bacterium GWF2_33_9]